MLKFWPHINHIVSKAALHDKLILKVSSHVILVYFTELFVHCTLCTDIVASEQIKKE